MVASTGPQNPTVEPVGFFVYSANALTHTNSHLQVIKMNKGLDIFALATDKEASIKGVKKEWNGATVVVARSNNVDYLKYIAEQYEKCRAAIDVGNAHSDEVAEGINKEAFIRFILVGWEGFVDQKGAALPYNLKNARKVYDAVPDLIRDVRMMAATDENYRVKNLQKDAENLGK